MKTVSFFVLGLLAGWLIEWIIDWLYWRRKYQQAQEENVALRERVASLEAKPRRAATPAKARSEKDNLKLISGIGPVISKKLYDAGIVTFEQVAELKPRQLEKILGELIRRLSDEEDLITQAKKLAEKKAQRLKSK